MDIVGFTERSKEADQLLASAGLSGSEIEAHWADATKQENRKIVRDAIDKVADTKTREGVISDVLGVVVVGLSQLTVALSKAKSLADVNAAAQPLADIGAVVDAALKSGSLKLPYMVKTGGAQGVLADMTKLSNGVAAVFAAAQTPAK
ncbi:hypothetical protein C5F52_14215 [Limnohabitans sp. TS-CS-82]|uniref:hypothetical protein n=1 Tax=Limnohabitans sp. TS-CS-82 TaxID=2094193 RepID=UPI000CF2893C|nr:hypothetical protein [Limnohabitans sp. TS-CS-82]PQA82730.1 hypothetical protein C5F52_14215 [Limnohabitans sp. TS-CS-82]